MCHQLLSLVANLPKVGGGGKFGFKLPKAAFCAKWKSKFGWLEYVFTGKFFQTFSYPSLPPIIRLHWKMGPEPRLLFFFARGYLHSELNHEYNWSWCNKPILMSGICFLLLFFFHPTKYDIFKHNFSWYILTDIRSVYHTLMGYCFTVFFLPKLTPFTTGCRLILNSTPQAIFLFNDMLRMRMLICRWYFS